MPAIVQVLEDYTLHDWTLDGIDTNWPERSVKFKIAGWDKELDTDASFEINALRFSELVIPCKQEWGRSESINRTFGPEAFGEDESILKMEMQSGDVIVLVAASIELSKLSN